MGKTPNRYAAFSDEIIKIAATTRAEAAAEVLKHLGPVGRTALYSGVFGALHGFYQGLSQPWATDPNTGQMYEATLNDRVRNAGSQAMRTGVTSAIIGGAGAHLFNKMVGPK